MDYEKVKVSDLSVNDKIVWRGRVHLVVEKLSPGAVRVREYKNKKVAEGTLLNRWRTIQDDIYVDRGRI